MTSSVRLYLIRKRASHLLRNDERHVAGGRAFYVCSLSTKVMIYKGMLTPGPGASNFYPD